MEKILIPIVSYRYEERAYVTEFVKPFNAEIEYKAALLADDLEIISFIRDKFVYPMVKGLPSTDGQRRRFKKNSFSFHYSGYEDYMWSYPEECLVQRFGICIDTSLLCTSLLIAKNYDAYVAIGEIRSQKDNELVGYHAWTVYNNTIVETTVHNSDSITIVDESKAYNRYSEWAKKNNLYYIEHGKFNHNTYTGTTDLGSSGVIVELLALPIKAAKLNLMHDNFEDQRKKMHKQWSLDEFRKFRLLESAYAKGNVVI